MNESIAISARVAGSGITLYMLMILLTWLGPWIEVDTRSGRLAWIGRLTLPLLRTLRNVLPVMGPFDFAPVAAVLGLWLLRSLLISLMLAPVLRGT